MRFGFAMLTAVLLLAAGPASAAGFSSWAAIVVAGDHRAHDGSDSEVFDNGRHDVGAALTSIGFAATNIEEFSTQAARYHAPDPGSSDAQSISNGLWDLSNRAPDGCLLYFTSHGSPDGIVMGDDMLSPKQMTAMINNSCGSKPTAVIVSACFSGVFVRSLAGPNRFVLTAARPDRTSFGCGQADRYTFFDQCFLESVGGAHDFTDLARNVRACVATREVKEHATPPSEPQVFIGAGVAQFPQW